MIGDLLDLEALSSLSDRQLVALREALRTAGYDARMLSMAESIAPKQFDAVRLPLVQASLATQPGPGAVLARLFAYRDALGRDDVTRALNPELAGALEACGVLIREGERVRSLLRLIPFGGVWIGSDDADAQHNPVMGPGATTQELLNTLPGSLPERVLDVGCGAGSLALVAAHRGATSVTAIDLDPRAVALTAWNARLNELEISVRVGDLLEPVRGESFDLVFAQPPFVPQPPDVEATTYLHGGSRGDELALRLLGGLPDVLCPGGQALVLMDTAPEKGSALDRVRTALPDVPLQVSVVDAPGHRADELALGYAAAADSTLGPVYADAARRYAAHLATLKIEQTRHALVVVRRPVPGDASWAVSVEPRGRSPYGARDLARLDAALAIASLSLEDLRVQRLRPPAGAQLVQAQPFEDDTPSGLRLVCPGARVPDQELSDAAARLLELAGQTDTVGDLIEAYAESCSDEPARVESAVLDFLRKALVSGMLEAPEEPPS
ncbi:MAG: methyltransferase [Nannocystales bacterium]